MTCLNLSLVLVTSTFLYSVLAQSPDVRVGSIFMPNYTPKKADDYVCTAQKIESVFENTSAGGDRQSWITAFRAKTPRGTVHHMLLMLCDDLFAVNQPNTSWECGHHGVCRNSHIIFGWAKNAAPTVLPPDVGFKVGGQTSSRFLVLQVHYAHPLTIADHSGFFISYTTAPQKYQAGIYLLMSLGSIPARKPVWHLDVNCRLSGNTSIHPFAFRAHAHSLGTVITGYRYSYKNQKLAEIARGNPQWPQAFYPVDYQTTVLPGDLLHARCTYNSSARDRVTYIGATSDDEMCNLYLMYYTDAARGQPAFVCGQEEVAELTAKLPEDSDHPLPPNPQLEQTASGAISPQTPQQPARLTIGKYNDQLLSHAETVSGAMSGNAHSDSIEDRHSTGYIGEDVANGVFSRRGTTDAPSDSIPESRPSIGASRGSLGTSRGSLGTSRGAGTGRSAGRTGRRSGRKQSVYGWVGKLIGKLAKSATKDRSSVMSTLSWMKGAATLMPYLPMLAKIMNSNSTNLPQNLVEMSRSIPRQRLHELQSAVVETLSTSAGQKWLFDQFGSLARSEADIGPSLSQLHLNITQLEDYSSFVTVPDTLSTGVEGYVEPTGPAPVPGSQLAGVVKLAGTPLGRTALAQLGNLIRMVNVTKLIDSLTGMASAHNLSAGVGRTDRGGVIGHSLDTRISKKLHSPPPTPQSPKFKQVISRPGHDNSMVSSHVSVNRTASIGDHLGDFLGRFKSMTADAGSLSSPRARNTGSLRKTPVGGLHQPAAVNSLLGSMSMVQEWLQQAASGTLDFRQALDGALDSRHVSALLHVLASLVGAGGAAVPSSSAVGGLIGHLSERADSGDQRGVSDALDHLMQNRMLRGYLHRLADQANTLRGNNVALNVSAIGPILKRYYGAHSQQGVSESSAGAGSAQAPGTGAGSEGSAEVLDMSRTWVINPTEYNGDTRNGKSLTNVKFVENWHGSGFNDLGQVTAVSLTFDQRRLVVFHRADRAWSGATFDSQHRLRDQTAPISGATIVYMDADSGRKLLEFGSNFFHMPHGLTIDDKDNIWCTDVGMHQVFKFGPEGGSGVPLLTIGERFVPGSDNNHLCKPTAVAVQTDGSVFVADGYCNARVLKLAHDGRVLATLGRQTSTFAMFGSVLGVRPAADRFNIPHALALSEPLSLLCVADRENGRVSCFNSHTLQPSGAYTVGLVNSRIFSVALVDNSSSSSSVSRKAAGDGGTPPPPPAHLYIVNGPNYIGNKVQGFVVDLSSGSVLSTFSPHGRGLSNPHDIAVTTDGGAIFVAELSPAKVWKFTSGSSSSQYRASPFSDEKPVVGSGWSGVFVVLVTLAPLIIVGTIIYRRFCYSGERGAFFASNMLRGRFWSDETVKDRSGFAPLNTADMDFDSDSDVEEYTKSRLNPRV